MRVVDQIVAQVKSRGHIFLVGHETALFAINLGVMKKLFFISLMISGILSAVAAIPGVSLEISVMTFGIGAFALIAAVNLFIALLCLLPVVVFSKPIAYPLAAVLLAAAFLGPGFLSDQAEQEIIKAEQSADIQSSNALSMRNTMGLELIRPDSANANLRTRLVPSQLCGSLCQRALHGGQVDWVRIITKSTQKNVQPTVSLARRDRAMGCEETLCIVFDEPIDAPADITIELDQKYFGPYSPNTRPEGWAKLQGWTRLTIFDGPKETGDVVWRQTNLSVIKIGKPASLTPNFEGATSGGNDGGLSIHRHIDRGERIDPEAAAAALGLKLAPAPIKVPRKRGKDNPQPTQAEAAKIASLLDQNGPIPKAFDGEIDGWLYNLNRAPEMTPADVALVLRIADDPRFPYKTGMRSLFAGKKELQAIMLPWLFDRLEEEPAFKEKFISWLALELSSSSIPMEALTPYAPRFRALLKGDRHKAVLLRAVGRFGFDPAPVLRENYKPQDHHDTNIIQAICNSAPEWYEGLVPLAREFANDQMANNPKRWLKDGTDKALRFLVHTGHREEVVAIVKSSDWSNKDQILENGFVTDHPYGTHDPNKPCGR